MQEHHQLVVSVLLFLLPCLNIFISPYCHIFCPSFLVHFSFVLFIDPVRSLTCLTLPSLLHYPDFFFFSSFFRFRASLVRGATVLILTIHRNISTPLDSRVRVIHILRSPLPIPRSLFSLHSTQHTAQNTRDNAHCGAHARTAPMPSKGRVWVWVWGVDHRTNERTR